MTKMKKLASVLLAVMVMICMTVPVLASPLNRPADMQNLDNRPGFSPDNPIELQKISDDGTVATYAADLGIVWIPMSNGVATRASTSEPFLPKAIVHVNRAIGTESVELQVTYIGSLKTTIKSGKCQFIKTYGAMGDKSNDNLTVTNATPPSLMITFKSIFILKPAAVGEKQYVGCGESALTLRSGDSGVAPPIYMTITLE